MTNYHYWQYFLSLENDLITTSRYIEFSSHVHKIDDRTIVIEDNNKTFSTELLRIFFASCAECENILKILVQSDVTTTSNLNITDLRRMIMASDYKTLSDITIFCPAYNLEFTPWKDWNIPSDINASPQWWKDHNILKHRRADDNNSNYYLANLSNTLNSVAALMCLLYEYYKKELDGNEGKYSVSLPAGLAPKLFIPKSEIAGLGYGNGYWVWQIPDQANS
jgi:hypothetical protein